MERSYRLLQHRMRSTAEIRRSLQAAGFPTRVVEEAISRLLQQGLLDDDAFARSWSESRQAFRPRSRRLIRKELRDKGIAPELADRLTEGIDDDVVALELARHKAASMTGLQHETFVRRLSRYLYNRGFTHSTVARTLSSVRSPEDVS